jgi:glutathione synthase/RimK-type ligase-like ATP-grasp enzyme
LPSLRTLTGPLVVKPAVGGGGVGVVQVVDAEAAAAHIERLSERLDFSDPELVVASARHYVVQPLIGDGCDYRVFVLNGQAIACTRRNAAAGEFRTNGSFGGVDEVWSDPAVEDVAVRATLAMGLHYAGVDVLVGPDGPQVLEVNGWAGFAHTEQVTGVPIAQELARFLLAGRPW